MSLREDKPCWSTYRQKGLKKKGDRMVPNCVPKESINEVLDISSPMSDWIKDFQNSDNPKFKGKSQEKRREMAIAAYLEAKRNRRKSQQRTAMDEEVELHEEDSVKVGDTVYLKTKKFSNSPHSGKVVKVTPTHVHLRTLGGSGMYKAPHSSVTKDKKESHLYKNYSERSEEVDLDEMTGANMSRRDLVSHIKKKGWTQKTSGSSGDHEVYTHLKSTQRLAIPRHNKLKTPLVLDILKKAKMMDKEMAEGFID